MASERVQIIIFRPNRVIANKIIIAVLCAALLLGSSTICTTNMTPKIMEIPLLGVFGYLAALVLSLRLIWDINKKRK